MALCHTGVGNIRCTDWLDDSYYRILVGTDGTPVLDGMRDGHQRLTVAFDDEYAKSHCDVYFWIARGYHVSYGTSPSLARDDPDLCACRRPNHQR